ncbi:MAG: agmatinase [Betaproteobacteria bacterium]
MDSHAPQHSPRYMELATFMRTPWQADPAGLQVALAGVPYDGGVTCRPGARHGPREIRNQSTLVRGIHHVHRINPFERLKVADVGDVRFSRIFDHEAVLADIEAFFARIHAAGARPLTAGGDHSITLPILRAIARQQPVGLVHVDAHTDTWGEWNGSRFHHGAPFRCAVEEGLVDPRRAVQIGIRGGQMIDDGWRFSRDSGMRVIFIEEFTALGVPAVIAEARRVVGDGPVYVTFDVDGLDPAYTPGTGTPEVGGITTREAQQLLQGLMGIQVMGADVVEVSPPFDPSGNTALVGATMMYELLCLMAGEGAPR